MAIGLPLEVALCATATKSPFGAATTQSPMNLPTLGLTLRCHRNAPSAVCEVTARRLPSDGPDTMATLPQGSAAIRAAWPALKVPAERPPAVHSTGTVIAAAAGPTVTPI